MALACVAMMENAIAYHGIEWPASMYLLTVFDVRPRQIP
jgi:hypothetical protein